ncbi:hypothetical protein [Shewanella sp. SM74]|uniref:hypothetical protein n=1 Tax=Shewanella sp. SM74 TaxID=2912807 RepID=UPI0021DA34E1|nr:hypothetical protein [Shewanella sp. SM74]MCU8012491.1 hypothetical protein [Shewanella sp. SM74]
MDLSQLIGGGKYLKRLNQVSVVQQFDKNDYPSILPANEWAEVLSLTGKHVIENVAYMFNVGNFIKYVIDGVESITHSGLQGRDIAVIGTGYSDYMTAFKTPDTPQYCKQSFKILIYRARSETSYIEFSARYSQVSVENMD